MTVMSMDIMEKNRIFIYDDKGNLIEEIFIYPDNSKYKDIRFTKKKVYRYDEKNRLIEASGLDRNNEPIIDNIAKTTYEYFDDNSYEVIHYFSTEKFGESAYGVYWKELIQEEYYETE